MKFEEFCEKVFNEETTSADIARVDSVVGGMIKRAYPKKGILDIETEIKDEPKLDPKRKRHLHVW